MEPVGQKDENKLSFRKPWTIRVVCVLFALFVVGTLPTVFFFELPYSKVPMDIASWFGFGIMEMVGLGFAAMFLYMSGPPRLFFDLNRRTYRYVFGWPFVPQVREGPWEDIAGIYVSDRNSGRLSGYSVGVAWKDNRVSMWQATSLGIFDGLGRLDRANRLAEKMASLLGVPLVDPPFPVRPPRTAL